ncbi:MAG: DNA repair protein RadA [Syntrophomonadaceae bacterium]
MGKNLSRFVCSECGYESLKWLGRCPGCGNWNSLMEELVSSRPAASSKNKRNVSLTALTEIPLTQMNRYTSGMGEFDRVLGGGMVPGSIVLLGGDPGIGKSTLLLQVADYMGRSGRKILYLSGEESAGQIRLRASRLGIENSAIYFLNDQNIDSLAGYLQQLAPDLVIIDSIQTVYSENLSSIPGSVSQLRECTAKITDLAKKSAQVFCLVGHVTKEGALAGPKVLEHMVDVVIYFEGEKHVPFRLLRGVKNRFGATDEIGLLEMSGAGLREVVDPTRVFLSCKDPTVSGSAVVASFEGSRPLLIEIQALVAPGNPGYPRRMASGIDQNRLALIIAVLEKRRGINLAACDVYLKITGGVFLRDPAIDLGIAAAVLSSYRERPLPLDMVYLGELALSGEIRSVPFLDARLKEIERLGYKRVTVPAGGKYVESDYRTLSVTEVKNLDDFIEVVMEGY